MLDPESTASRPDDKEFMATLAKGLAVLGCFGKQRPTMTLSEAAVAANVSRATARRILRTLAELGYVEQHGRQFALSPNILQLGFAYLATQSWIERALPLMKDLSERVHESCSAAILQGTEIVYVARVPTRRIMSVAVSVGSRLPAFHSSMGRVQLGFLDSSEIWRRLKSVRIEPLTPSHDHRPAGAVRSHSRRPRSRASRLSTRSWSAACARSPFRSWIATIRSLPVSISAPTRRGRPATRCGKNFCRSCAPSPRSSRRLSPKSAACSNAQSCLREGQDVS